MNICTVRRKWLQLTVQGVPYVHRSYELFKKVQMTSLPCLRCCRMTFRVVVRRNIPSSFGQSAMLLYGRNIGSLKVLGNHHRQLVKASDWLVCLNNFACHWLQFHNICDLDQALIYTSFFSLLLRNTPCLLHHTLMYSI